jgi:hypothetical protein
MMENKKRKAAELEESNTGIAHKVAVISSNIDVISIQIEEKEQEIESLDTDTNVTEEINLCKEQLSQLQKQLIRLQEKKGMIQQQKQQDELKDQLIQLQNQLIELYEQLFELYKQKDELKDKLIQLKDELKQLNDVFFDGEYYAFTDSYWELQEVTREGNEWQSFVRQFDEDEQFQCRYAGEKNAAITMTDPYAITRSGAIDSKYAVPDSATTRTGSMPPNDQTSQDAVWPTDIFGRNACSFNSYRKDACTQGVAKCCMCSTGH